MQPASEQPALRCVYRESLAARLRAYEDDINLTPTGHFSDQAELPTARARPSQLVPQRLGCDIGRGHLVHRVDLEFPRVGLVRLDATEKIPEDLHDSICE
jgi:hypothetical protein